MERITLYKFAQVDMILIGGVIRTLWLSRLGSPRSARILTYHPHWAHLSICLPYPVLRVPSI